MALCAKSQEGLPPIVIGADSWNVLLIGFGPAESAMEARLDGGFIERPYDSRVLDVAHWKYEVENTISLIKSNNKHPKRTRLTMGGKHGGRCFDVNPDGTISCVNAPHLVLGLSMPRLVLVPRDSPRRCVFEASGNLAVGHSASMSLVSPPGLGIVQLQEEPKTAHVGGVNWSYIELGIGRSDQAIQLKREHPKYLSRPPTVRDAVAKVLDVSMWQLEEGNTVNLVSGPSHGKTFSTGPGRDFELNADSSVSPSAAQQFVLGCSYWPEGAAADGAAVATQAATLPPALATASATDVAVGLPVDPRGPGSMRAFEINKASSISAKSSAAFKALEGKQANTPIHVKPEEDEEVFISFRVRETMKEASDLRSALDDRGVGAFVCEMQVGNGDDWLGLIAKKIEFARVVLVLGSRTYCATGCSVMATHEELHYALEARKPMYIVKTCDAYDEPKARLLLNHRQFTPLRRDTEAGAAEYSATVQKIADEVAAMVRAAREEELPLI